MAFAFGLSKFVFCFFLFFLFLVVMNTVEINLFETSAYAMLYILDK